MLKKKKKKKPNLNQVQNHNLSQERSVGFVNFELEICGKQNLESVSRKMVLIKSADLTINNSFDFRKYRKPAVEIKELKFQWNQKMEVLEQSRFSQKEFISTNIERKKLDDLDFLRKQRHPEPFTTSEAVTSFKEMKLRAKKRRNKCTLRSVFKGTLANHLRKKLLHSV